MGQSPKIQGIGACGDDYLCDLGILEECSTISAAYGNNNSDDDWNNEGEIYTCFPYAPMTLERAAKGCICPNGKCSIALSYK